MLFNLLSYAAGLFVEGCACRLWRIRTLCPDRRLGDDETKKGEAGS